MIARALGEGLHSATRRPGLVTLLWGWNLALALLVALPFWGWSSSFSRLAPATDPLLDGLDIGLVTHLVRSGPAVIPVLGLAVVGLIILSLLSGAFISGGILEIVLNEGDGRRLLTRFFQGAGAFVGRFTRLLVLAGITVVLVVGLLATGAAAVAGVLTDGGSEAARLAGTITVQALVVLVALYFVVSLDYARAMTVITGNRGMTRTWFRAMGFVLRHLPSVAFIGLIAAVGVVAALAASVAYDVSYSARTWSVILGAILLQQAMAWLRTAVRVGQLGAQGTYCAGLLPVPAAAEAAQFGQIAPETAPATDPAIAGSEAIPDKITQAD